MSGLEPTINLGELVSSLETKLDVTLELRNRIKNLLKVPHTLEEIDSMIAIVNSKSRPYPMVSLSSMDAALVKAKFYVNAEEIDYV